MYENQAKEAAYAGADRQVMAQGYGAAVRGGLVCGDEAKRQLEVPGEMSKLAAAIEFSEHSLIELHKRLEGKVIRPSMPEPTTAAGGQLAAVGPSTGYGQEIHGYAMRAHQIGERVQDLLRRLEV